MTDYWNKAQCDLLPLRLSVLYFDCCVNQGVPTAIKILQKSLGLPDDGILGSKTEEIMKVSNPANDYMFMALRAIHYSNCGDFAIFGRGWFNRLFNLVM